VKREEEEIIIIIHVDEVDVLYNTRDGDEKCENILVGKPEGKRPRCRWEDNIKTGLRGMEL
jgi:hypothetical protein